MGIGEVTRQASFFLQDKYKTVKRVVTDVTQAEQMTQEATNSEPCSPDARTMLRISEAAYETDDYWRIVDVLHGRLHTVDFKEWRQSYKALVLLEFLLTHGPEDIGEQFQSDLDIIEDLGTFKHVDERGIDWGAGMQKKSERIMKLLTNMEFLREERAKSIKLSHGIQGFGSASFSPPSVQLASPSSSSSNASSFGPCLSRSSEKSNHEENLIQLEEKQQQHGEEDSTRHFQSHRELPVENGVRKLLDEDATGTYLSNGYLLHPTQRNDQEDSHDKTPRKGSFRSLSEVKKLILKKFDRQLSLGF